jgi:hypothetical protein
MVYTSPGNATLRACFMFEAEMEDLPAGLTA